MFMINYGMLWYVYGFFLNNPFLNLGPFMVGAWDLSRFGPWGASAEMNVMRWTHFRAAFRQSLSSLVSWRRSVLICDALASSCSWSCRGNKALENVVCRTCSVPRGPLEGLVFCSLVASVDHPTMPRLHLLVQHKLEDGGQHGLDLIQEPVLEVMMQECREFASKTLANWVKSSVLTLEFVLRTELFSFAFRRKRFTDLFHTAGRFAAGERFRFCQFQDYLLCPSCPCLPGLPSHFRALDGDARTGNRCSICGIGLECLAHAVQGFRIASVPFTFEGLIIRTNLAVALDRTQECHNVRQWPWCSAQSLL